MKPLDRTVSEGYKKGTDVEILWSCAKKTAFRKFKKWPIFEGSFSRKIFRDENSVIFLPTFSDGFSRRFSKMAKRQKKAQKKWANGQKFLKSGRAETIGAQRFAGLLPTFPLFIPTIIKKKVKFYKELKTKVGFWPKPFFSRKFRKTENRKMIFQTSFFSCVIVVYFRQC